MLPALRLALNGTTRRADIIMRQLSGYARVFRRTSSTAYSNVSPGIGRQCRGAGECR